MLTLLLLISSSVRDKIVRWVLSSAVQVARIASYFCVMGWLNSTYDESRLKTVRARP